MATLENKADRLNSALAGADAFVILHKALVEQVAGRINSLASREGGSIYLAAPQTMIQPLLGSLDSGVRQRVKKELPLGLVKAPKLDLLKRFELS